MCLINRRSTTIPKPDMARRTVAGADSYILRVSTLHVPYCLRPICDPPRAMTRQRVSRSLCAWCVSVVFSVAEVLTRIMLCTLLARSENSVSFNLTNSIEIRKDDRVPPEPFAYKSANVSTKY